MGMLDKKHREEKRKTTVYCAVNLVNGKRYIGITCGYLSQRKSKHFWTAKKRIGNAIFSKAIRKYGPHNFEFKVLEVCSSYSEAAQKEIDLIKELNPEYNVTKGGEGFLGYVPTKEAIEKIREANIGRPGYWKGKKLMPHVIEAIRKRGIENKDEWMKRIRIGQQARRKRVVCCNDGIVHEGVRIAARFYGVDSSSITEVCKNKGIRKSVGGLKFAYAEVDHELVI